jgi:hypothetical protein
MGDVLAFKGKQKEQRDKPIPRLLGRPYACSHCQCERFRMYDCGSVVCNGCDTKLCNIFAGVYENG